MAGAIELDRLPTRPAAVARTPSQERATSPASLKRTPSPPGLDDLARLDRTPSAAESSIASTLTGDHAVLELEPVDRGKGAYVFLLNSFMLELILWGYTGAWGSVQLYLSTHEPFASASLGSLGAVGTICLGLYYILPLPLVYLSRRFPHLLRRALWIALAVNVVAMFGSSFATNVGELIFLQGIVGGVSGAVMYIPALIWLQDWFIVKRGAAAGIIFAGTGAGGAAFPLALSGLLNKIGFAWTTRFWALVTLVTLTSVIWTIRPRVPITRPAPATPFAPIDWSFLRHKSAIPMSLLAVTASCAFFPILTYITTFTTSVSSPLSGDIVLSVLNLTYTLGGLAIAWLSDRVGYAYLLAFLGASEAVAAFASWGTADTLAKVFGFAVLFGALGGQINGWTALSRDVAGSDQSGAAVICSFMFVLRGISCIVAPLVAASLYKPEQAGAGIGFGHFGFGGVMVWVGTMAAASALAGLYMAAIRPSSRRKHHKLN